MKRSSTSSSTNPKPSSSSSINPKKPSNIPSSSHNNIKFSYHNYTNLTNQQYLFHSLKLLGISSQQYLKQTKLLLKSQYFNTCEQIFGKSISVTQTKQFFFIVYKCMQKLCSTQDQFNMIKIWYPPRTINQQSQFKKVLFNLLQKLEGKNKVPKKFIISKNFLITQTNSSKIIEFLRILAELALRQDYLNKYSKKERLVEIEFNQNVSVEQRENQPNDINRAYIYPYTPSSSPLLTQPSLCLQQIQSLKQIYLSHISLFRKKILSLSQLYPKQQSISCGQLMSSLQQQSQISQKLLKKIPKQYFTQNRSFDRRQLIDKSQYVWSELMKIQGDFIGKSLISEDNVLKMQGEIDKMLKKWDVPKGGRKVIEGNLKLENLDGLKRKCQDKIIQFKEFKDKIAKVIK